ncbi:putative ABC transport system permease protein [Pseudarthrobacter enclensis]|uniref:ABC3 transporter permease C-terminal domain-containing protein n=1 Tax=Pseudarthrobacter enclensis TaxID=993070 RepID=A0A0V8IGE0_9MICC|nr:FtsX-like permease family protein [Pseudarthrobacter enclensis]KSU73831.1 hypothetical protein AS031_14130 [Pseudarthrobacter enclensis]SCC18523.1 putative ABC transport system permease protein [Pseudarthrobacter enclensis]
MPDGHPALDLAPARGARRSSFRIAARMARRDILRHKGRSLLIILLIMLPVAGMSGAATLYQSSLRTPAEIVRYELGNTQARYAMLPVPNGESLQDPLNDTIVASSTGELDQDFRPSPPEDLLPDGYEVLPLRQLKLTATAGDAAVPLQGRQVDALHPAFEGKFTLLEGRAPATGDEVLVSPGLIERFALSFGEEFTTSAGTFVPVGTIRDADASDRNSILYLRQGQGPAALGQGDASPQSVSYYLAGAAPVTWEQVRAANSRGVGVLSRSVVLSPPPPDEQTVPGAIQAGTPSEQVAAYGTFGLVGALALLEVGLLAGAAFAVGAKNQVRELALLAASGAEAPTIRAVVTASGLWLGGAAVASGAVAGVGAAAVVVWWVRSTGSARLAGVHPDPLLTGTAMAMGLAACLLAALAPANRVARQALVGALKSGRAPAAGGKRTTLTGAVLLPVAAGLLAAGWLVAQSAADPDERARQAGLVSSLLAGGAVLGVVALVLLTGWLTTGLTPRTGSLPLALRMAARDSARNRGRTVPAVAAVLAAATLASAALVLSASQQAGQRLSHSWSALENQAYLPLSLAQPPQADGTIPPAITANPEHLSTAVSGALDSVSWTRTVTTPAPVRNCGFGEGAGPAGQVTTDVSNCLQYSLARPAGQACPLTAQRRVVDPDDWRCRGSMAWDQGSDRSILVGGAEDIRAMFGREAGADAVAALNAGAMVVTNPVFIRDGKVELQGQDVRTQQGSPDGSVVHDTVSSTVLEAVTLEPSVAVPYYGIVSPATAHRLNLAPEAAGLAVQLSRAPSAAEVDAVTGAIAGVFGQPGIGFWAEPGVPKDQAWMGWLIVAVSALVTFSAAGITTGLSLADARTDHATLAGVGAAPRLRKALAASQALFTAGLGAVLGTLAGAVPAVLIVVSTDLRTALDVPWLPLAAMVAAVPVTASALAWAFTRVALPMTRRAPGG